ncbi:MAG: hypothetical protein DME96_05300 [Verrucomicrobia bacterium]|nr:MAG: hypothetical protein DME96_05300 [Verrucomicrobiota bacterium]
MQEQPQSLTKGVPSPAAEEDSPDSTTTRPQPMPQSLTMAARLKVQMAALRIFFSGRRRAMLRSLPTAPSADLERAGFFLRILLAVREAPHRGQ